MGAWEGGKGGGRQELWQEQNNAWNANDYGCDYEEQGQGMDIYPPDIYNSCLTCKATRIAGDPTHPLHSLFSLLPLGWKLESPGQNQQAEGQFPLSGSQETHLSPCSIPTDFDFDFEMNILWF